MLFELAHGPQIRYLEYRVRAFITGFSLNTLIRLAFTLHSLGKLKGDCTEILQSHYNVYDQFKRHQTHPQNSFLTTAVVTTEVGLHYMRGMASQF